MKILGQGIASAVSFFMEVSGMVAPDEGVLRPEIRNLKRKRQAVGEFRS